MHIRAGFFVVAALLLAPVVAGAQTPTFAKDVAPILYSKCVECHRPTMFAPMSLVKYDEARPWAKSIRARVASRTMPPWGADPAHGVFKNDPQLKLGWWKSQRLRMRDSKLGLLPKYRNLMLKQTLVYFKPSYTPESMGSTAQAVAYLAASPAARAAHL